MRSFAPSPWRRRAEGSHVPPASRDRPAVRAAGIAAIIALFARITDGPIGPFPGGPLASGELVTGPDPDWTFAAETSSIELQVNPPHPLSRTVWVLVDQGQLFVPAGLASRKTWPSQAVADGRDDTWFFRLAPRPTT